MKYVRVMEDITIEGLNGETVKTPEGEDVMVSFKQFLLGRLGDPIFGNSSEDVFSAVRLREKIEGFSGASYLELETADWEKLVRAVKTPSPQVPYNPAIAFNLAPFMKSVINASDALPKEEDVN